jgi:tetratricopeptide (TPR) repeat protein
MFEAYAKHRSLGLLEARLPNDVVQVIDELNRLLETEPRNTCALFLLARCFSLGEDLNNAKRTFETLLEQDPDNVLAKTELAKIVFNENSPRDAIRLLAEVTNVRPEFDENWRLLSEALQQDGQTEASQDALKQRDMIKAFNDKLQLAEQAFANADLKAADEICRHLLQLVPNEYRAFRLLARIARQLGHHEFSSNHLVRYVEAIPDNVELGLEYVRSLFGSRQYQEALKQCQRLIELAPERIEVYELKAEALFFLCQYEGAIEIYRELSEVPDKSALSLVHLGKVLKTVGDIPEATLCYQQAIKKNPTLGQAYWELADLKTYRFSEDETSSMLTMLEATEVSAQDRVLIEFALGKALEDAEQFKESFKHYQSANSRYATIRPFRYSSPIADIKSVFSAEYFSDRKDFGDESDAAIFVVGLPRSGTTLVEQILSSHSLIDATQELDEIVSIARSMNDPNRPERYPQSLANSNSSQIQEFAQRYLDFAGTYRGQAPYFVDKAPHNFHHVGLIKTLFPNAKIIDVRRNPMASGWSLYRQFFSDSYLFSYDLESIGKYYTDYVELMNHWQSVLPEKTLTIHYEDLVNNLPATVNTLLDYCGLDLEDGCLHFHLNRRAVATPSSEQVRQPLYTSAIEHWKNYEEFLSPLKQVLEDNGHSLAS